MSRSGVSIDVIWRFTWTIFRKNLKYSKDHEWVRLEGDKAFVGITDHAQSELGEIVFVELPPLGERFNKDEEISTVESVKAASAIINPIEGRLLQSTRILMVLLNWSTLTVIRIFCMFLVLILRVTMMSCWIQQLTNRM